MSSIEEEYVVSTTIACHVVWIRILLKDMGHTEMDPTFIFYDNISVTQLPKHNIFHKKSKHIDTCYHFIHELVEMDKFPYYFLALRSSWLTCSSRTSAFDYEIKQLGIDNDADILRSDYGGVSSHLVTHSIFCPMVFTHGIAMF